MENHNIYLKFDGQNLTWASAMDGSYTPVDDKNPSTPVNGKDTVTFTAVEGIDKIIKIEDGKKGSKKMIKSVRGEDSRTVIATLKDTTIDGEVDQYNIMFKPEGGGKPIIVDPELLGKGHP